MFSSLPNPAPAPAEHNKLSSLGDPAELLFNHHWSAGKELKLDDKMSPFTGQPGLVGETKNGTSSGYNSPTSSSNSGTSLPQAADMWQAQPACGLESSVQHSILEDPFDAEWAAIATRNYGSSNNSLNKNPFLQEGPVKTFEFHL